MCKSKKSKRIPTHKKMKLNRKIKKAKKKMARQYKKMKLLNHGLTRKKKKVFKVPNSYPFKKQLLLKLKAERDEIKRLNVEKAHANVDKYKNHNREELETGHNEQKENLK